MKFIPTAVSTRVARQALLAQKNSPTLLVAAGVVGMGATVVLACKATLKVDAVLESLESTLHHIDESVGKSVIDGGQYTEKDAKKDKVIVITRASVDLAKLYGPAVIVGALTVSAFIGSHNILSRRNAALTAAYGTLAKAMDNYRDRVRTAYGEERERELYTDAQPCEIDDPKTGKKIKTVVSGGGSPYAQLFDEHNVNWVALPESNFTFLKLQQKWASQRLQAKGHLFLNEVYDELGLDRTKEGAVVGWVMGSDGDGYVDFGIFNEDHRDQLYDFMSGRQPGIWLDFNVDGVIYDKI